MSCDGIMDDAIVVVLYVVVLYVVEYIDDSVFNLELSNLFSSIPLIVLSINISRICLVLKCIF